MKRRFISWLRWICSIVLLLPLAGFAPLPPLQPSVESGQISDLARDDITPQEEQAVWARIQENIAALRRTGRGSALDSLQSVTYELPLRMAPGLTDYGGFTIAAFPDHDPASGVTAVRDYNGGNRTYDGHQGTDYGLYPFKWNKVDAGEMQVVAAAAGTIVIRDNATPADHSCAVNNLTGGGNMIALQHADGRVTFYAHMKYNSLTSKTIGQTVAQGEFLGLVASSGNSSGPHLHFEVREASVNGKWIDPNAGPYSQAESLWANQPAYHQPGVIKLATLSTLPAFNNCAAEAVTNQDSFTTPAIIYLYTFFRDYEPGLPLVFNLYRPDGSRRITWPDVPSGNTYYPAMYFKWTVDIPSSEQSGTWRFEVLYNGQTYQTYFNVNAPPSVSLVTPNGGEEWDQLSGHAITWTGSYAGAVNLALYRSGVYIRAIASNLTAGGSYTWSPDSSLAPGAGYTVRISSAVNSAVVDESSAPFSLLPTTLTHQVLLPFIRR